MKRYAMKADISQKPIVQALRACGDAVHIIGRPVDLLVRTHARFWTAEVKTPGKNVKRRMQAQIEHAEDTAQHGAPHFVLTSVDDALHCRSNLINRTT